MEAGRVREPQEKYPQASLHRPEREQPHRKLVNGRPQKGDLRGAPQSEARPPAPPPVPAASWGALRAPCLTNLLGGDDS